MRLIDADEILTRIQKAYVDTDFGTNKRAIAINIGLTKALNNVQDCEKFELKKGKWIVDDEFIDCSACRREKWSRVPYEPLVKRFRYCPNCGADMRGETDG